jgi:Arc/MetJ-type ribon-helix-helix transcriptional regulator
MARKPKKESERFKYDLRAKVPQEIHDAVVEEAARRFVDKSHVVREAVIDYLERARRIRGEAPALKVAESPPPYPARRPVTEADVEKAVDEALEESESPKGKG